MSDAEAIDESTTQEHPAFTRAKALPEHLRNHFPKSPEEAREFKRYVTHRALAAQVLAVATTRIECAWCAYCDAVPGMDHRNETEAVLRQGSKLDEKVARALFPQFDEVEYAR